MKNLFAWIPLAAVVGGIVGAWGPMEELRALRDRADEAKAAARPSGRAGFDPISQFINVPAAARRPRRARPAADGPGSETNAPPAAAGAAASGRPRPMLSPEDLQARIDEAADLWRTRIQLVRATALENLGLEPGSQGAEAFDTVLSDMNDRLRESMQAVADMLADGEKMTPEVGARLMGDISSALVDAYESLGESIDSSKRGDVSEMNLAEFVDPSVAEPLVAVQDRLNGGVFSGRTSGK